MKSTCSVINNLISGVHRRLVFSLFSHGQLMRYYTKLNHIKNSQIYSTYKHPCSKFWVQPSIIKHRNRKIKSVFGLGQIVCGQWDTETYSEPVRDFHIYSGLVERFEKNWDWENTVYYEHAKKKISNQGSYWGYNSIDEFKKYRCQSVDDLFKSMVKQGYKPSSKHNPPKQDSRNSRRRYLHSLEVMVAIGSDGEIYINDGLHRFAIAEIIGIPIAVQIVAIHREWQKSREDLIKKNPESFKIHPNLTEIEN